MAGDTVLTERQVDNAIAYSARLAKVRFGERAVPWPPSWNLIQELALLSIPDAEPQRENVFSSSTGDEYRINDRGQIEWLDEAEQLP